MKHLLSLMLLISISTTSFAALSGPTASPVVAETKTPDLDRKTIEAQLGRKLNFAERIVLGSVKRKAKRQARRGQRSGPFDALAIVSFGLGVLTILSTFTLSGVLFILSGLGAIITGIVALVNLGGKNDYKRGRGFAIAGIAAPVASLALLFLFIVLFFFN